MDPQVIPNCQKVKFALQFHQSALFDELELTGIHLDYLHQPHMDLNFVIVLLLAPNLQVKILMLEQVHLIWRASIHYHPNYKLVT